MGIEMLVDGIEGKIESKIEVKYVMKKWYGEIIESIIEYVKYVMIKDLEIYKRGLMGKKM